MQWLNRILTRRKQRHGDDTTPDDSPLFGSPGYGLNISDPVVCGGGVDGEYTYIHRLRCPNGCGVRFSRNGSRATQKVDYLKNKGVVFAPDFAAFERLANKSLTRKDLRRRVMLDTFTISCECGLHTIQDVFFDMYHIGPDKPPQILNWTLSSMMAQPALRQPSKRGFAKAMDYFSQEQIPSGSPKATTVAHLEALVEAGDIKNLGPVMRLINNNSSHSNYVLAPSLIEVLKKRGTHETVRQMNSLLKEPLPAFVLWVLLSALAAVGDQQTAINVVTLAADAVRRRSTDYFRDWGDQAGKCLGELLRRYPQTFVSLLEEENSIPVEAQRIVGETLIRNYTSLPSICRKSIAQVLLQILRESIDPLAEDIKSSMDCHRLDTRVLEQDASE